MLITLEWGQRSILADRLGDIAEVLGVTAADLLADPTAPKQPEAN